MDGPGSSGPRAGRSVPGRLREVLARFVARLADRLIRALGAGPSAGREEFSSDELREMVAANTVLGAEQRALIDDVLSAGRRPVREVMVPRTEAAFLPAHLTVSRALRQAGEAEHSRYPVVDGSPDDVVGFVRLRDLLVRRSGDRTLTVRELARPIAHLPAGKPVVAALSELRAEGYPMAVVVDEYGGTAGILTMEDLIEELVGELRDELVDELSAPGPDGAPAEVDGLTNLTDLADRTGLRLPDGPYETLGGYLMARLGRLPAVGDRVEVDGWRLCVLTLDGRRACRVSLLRRATAELAAIG